jgi:hypothetical protein
MPVQALLSSRDSGLNLGTAIGELVDNSFEAGARHIRIATVRDNKGSIVELGLADDGQGIPAGTLANVLSLGYSSHHDGREGLGRFGLGLKLASLSQAQRLEVHSKAQGTDRIFSTCLDLKEIAAGANVRPNVVEASEWPEKFAKLMSDPSSDKPFASGTLIVWREIDRLREGGRFGTSIDEKTKALEKFLARAFRRFIDKGLKIELNGREVTLHDPLFLLYNPRVARRFPGAPRAKVVESGSLEIDGHELAWRVSLLPRDFREKKPNRDRDPRGREAFADLYIPENESKVSLLRNGREIFYDVLPKLYPGSRVRVDRFIGVEIEFPAAVDEYFQVRNVKDRAEPVSKLREELRSVLEAPIKAARREVLAYWDQVEGSRHVRAPTETSAAQKIAERFERSAPAGRANPTASAEEVATALEQILEVLAIDPADRDSAEAAEWLRDSFDKRVVTMLRAQLPEKEIVRIKHLGGKVIMLLNERHPFTSRLLNPLKTMATADPADLDSVGVSELLKRLSVGLDLLLIAYAKAESMHAKPEAAYGELRANWGLFSAGIIDEASKGHR